MDAVIGLPIFQIQIAGQNLPREVEASLAGLRIQQRLSQPTLCELYFTETPAGAEIMNLVGLGDNLRVDVASQLEPVFTGRVTAIEQVYAADGRISIYVRGYDALHLLRQEINSAVFVSVSLVDLITQSARPLNIKLNLISPADINTLSWPCIIQSGQSDLDFLVEQSYRLGRYLFIHNNTLYGMTLEGLPKDPFTLTYRGNLREVSAERNLDRLAQKVFVRAWNIEEAEIINAWAGRPRTASQEKTAYPEPGVEKQELFGQVVVNDQHARLLAQAELDRHYASAATYSGTADGSPQMHPGRRVRFEGLAPRLNNMYVLTEVTHIYDPAGYRVEFSTLPPKLALRPASANILLGKVLDHDDPEHSGRVLVEMAGFSGKGASWLPVAAPGAGKQKGLTAAPYIGDLVLVIVSSENPGLGVVLGGLFGKQVLPEKWMDFLDNNARTYGWVTPNHQKIQLRDGLHNAIRLQVSDGAYIELNEKHITIAGEAIDFKKL